MDVVLERTSVSVGARRPSGRNGLFSVNPRDADYAPIWIAGRKRTLFLRLREHNEIVIETEYRNECNLLSTEIDDAMAIFHTYEEVNRLSVQNKNILRALNADALFWKVQVYSLQTSLFIVLGRIFDTDPDAHSIHKIVRATQEHLEFFSKEAIATRKSAGGVKPDWLNDYLIRVWEPEPIVLRALRKELARYSKRFEDVYRPIRHQIFAHKLHNSGEAISRLFETTNREELENILDFLRDLMEAIDGLYLNGIKPELGVRSHDDYANEIRSSTKSVLDKVVAAMGEP